MLEHSSRIMFPEAISILQRQTEDTLRNHGKQHLPNHPFSACCIPRSSQSDQEKGRRGKGKAGILSSIRTNAVWREFKAGTKYFSALVLRSPNYPSPQWTELTTGWIWKMLVELLIRFLQIRSEAICLIAKRPFLFGWIGREVREKKFQGKWKPYKERSNTPGQQVRGVVSRLLNLFFLTPTHFQLLISKRKCHFNMRRWAISLQKNDRSISSLQILEHFNDFEYSLLRFFWLKVFAHTASFKLCVIVDLLRKKSNNPKIAAIETHKIAWVIIISCICVALGFTSRDYWGTSIFKPNSLRYVEMSVDPEELNCSHHSFSIAKNQVQGNTEDFS